MKIALVTGNYWPRVGGAEAHVRALARELAKSNEVGVLTLDNPSHEFTLEVETNVKICRASRGISFRDIVALPSWKGASEFHAALEEFDPDIVCTFTRFYLTTPMAQRWALNRGVPHVHSELGGGYVKTSSALVNLFSFTYDQIIGKQILRKSNRVIGLSLEAQAFINNWTNVEARVVGNGIDIDFWSQLNNLTQQRNANGTVREFIYVGRLVPEKGLPMLLEALRTLSVEEREDVILNVVAPAEQIETCELFSTYSDLAKNIRIHPSPSKTEIRELYARSTYLNPSTASEGFQTTLLEASATGCYIYTNNVGGAVEVVPSSRFGQIFSDGLLQNWAHVFKRANHSGSDRIDTSNTVKNFAWSNVANRYISVFESLENESNEQ